MDLLHISEWDTLRPIIGCFSVGPARAFESLSKVVQCFIAGLYGERSWAHTGLLLRDDSLANGLALEHRSHGDACVFKAKVLAGQW